MTLEEKWGRSFSAQLTLALLLIVIYWLVKGCKYLYLYFTR